MQCSRQNDFYLLVGENLVFPLAVLEDGSFLALTCRARGSIDPKRLERRDRIWRSIVLDASARQPTQ